MLGLVVVNKNWWYIDTDVRADPKVILRYQLNYFVILGKRHKKSLHGLQCLFLKNKICHI